ncbi:MAG: D-alanyl-D-alanine carboxypeptidase family protein [Pseudomonadota bacterium]
MRAALIFLCFLAQLNAALGQTDTITTDAQHAVILDYQTGAVLWAKDADTPMVPASMTKMMTAQVVLEEVRRGRLALTDRVPVSEDAWRRGGWSSGGSTMGLAIGDEPTVAELLRGVIVLSGNDACIALAEAVAGSESEFAKLMNETAKRLGLSSAHFDNATGLYTDTQRISARDLARLAAFQIDNFPDLYELYQLPEYGWRGIVQPNRNPLLGAFPGADGLKTGHLQASGYGLTASAVRGKDRRIIVINGLESENGRRDAALGLMGAAFTAFESRSQSAGDVVLSQAAIWLGETTEVDVVLGESIEVVASASEFEEMTSELVLASPLVAPIAAGQHIGQLEISIPNRKRIVVPVVAKQSVEALDFWGRARRGLGGMFGGGAD